MSRFEEKLRKGELPSDQDWESHLIEAHAKEPRMTPEAFAAFNSEDGNNSYQILANQLPLPPRDLNLIDLGCGDGHLMSYLLPRLGPDSSAVGVDLSPEGLTLAERQFAGDPRVKFILARAQTLPIGDAFADHILSHMALMLMSPLEPVVNEIRRTLKPGGRFSAVIGGGSRSGLYEKIHRVAALFVRTHLPRYSDARAGSSTLGNERDFEALFADGFGEIESREFQLRFHVRPEGVWDYLRNMYFTPMLPEPARREFKDEILHLAKDHADDEGKVLFYVPMKMLSVQGTP